MKQILVAFTLCVGLAVASGCKYSDTEGNAGAGGADGITGNTTEIPGGSDLDDITSDDGDIVTQRPFSEMYQRVEGVEFTPVYFKFDATAIPASEAPKIEAVANDLRANNKHVVVVEGHCDERGANDYNMSLGENRASKVRDYLMGLGITEDRIQTKSWGEEKPAVAESNESAWVKNRRAEFILYTK